jgi:hypothetical protein
MFDSSCVVSNSRLLAYPVYIPVHNNRNHAVDVNLYNTTTQLVADLGRKHGGFLHPHLHISLTPH